MEMRLAKSLPVQGHFTAAAILSSPAEQKKGCSSSGKQIQEAEPFPVSPIRRPRLQRADQLCPPKNERAHQNLAQLSARSW